MKKKTTSTNELHLDIAVVGIVSLVDVVIPTTDLPPQIKRLASE